MNYILICIGDYRHNTKTTIQSIADNIMPIVSSPTVKYYNNEYNLIYHFQSKINFDELKNFVDNAITPFVGMYFLNTCNTQMSLGMPVELYDYLFNLTDSNTQVPDMNSLNIICNDIQIDEEFTNVVQEIHDQIMFDMEEMGLMDDSEDDDLARIVRKSKKMDKVPTLDNLLDKITTKGIGSLSNEEKELLEQYSK